MPRIKGHHFTLEDRLLIEHMLKNSMPLREIARALEASPSAISNEVKRNRIAPSPLRIKGKRGPGCANRSECHLQQLCERCYQKDPLCKTCRMKDCASLCAQYSPPSCPDLDTAPFVCDGCSRRIGCKLPKVFYVASKAQQLYEERLRKAHLGTACSNKDIEHMVGIVKPLLRKGHSPDAIWAIHGDELPVGVRTFYNYVRKSVGGLAAIELPRQVRYKPRKQRRDTTPRMDITGRTYADWLELSEEERMCSVQMDIVEGKRSDSKCILTLYFPRFQFQLYVLLPSKTKEAVIRALDALELYCDGMFGEVFPVILTDRGMEFRDYESLERGIGGTKRTRIYYCDAQSPSQKGACERNHVELRRVLPKGSSFDQLTQLDVAIVCSHINSYVRRKCCAAPIDLARVALPQGLLEHLGVIRIEPDDVVMTPALLDK